MMNCFCACHRVAARSCSRCVPCPGGVPMSAMETRVLKLYSDALRCSPYVGGRLYENLTTYIKQREDANSAY